MDKKAAVEKEVERVKNTNVGANPLVQETLRTYGSTELKSGITLAELVKRPELDYDKLAPIDPNRPLLSDAIREQVNIQLKYEGYIKRQIQQVQQFKKLESKKLYEDFDYSQVKGLRLEAYQKLNLYKPVSVGQASRISGVSPADISVLLVYLEQYGHRNRRQEPEE